MAMFKTGTPVQVGSNSATEMLNAIEKLSFTLQTASEEECQKALSAVLKKHISIEDTRLFIARAKAKEQ